MIKAVIFDMDGVLIDTEKYLVRYWCQAAAEFGFDMKPEHGLLIRSLAGKFAKPLLEELFGEEFQYEKIRQRRKELMNDWISRMGIEKKPGVDELLNYLKENGFKTAVATATDEIRAEKYLKTVGIHDKFDEIICASMVENGKPEPDIYLYACERIAEKPEVCMAVEDSPNGIKAAVRAGCKTVMVPDLTQPEEALSKCLFAKEDRIDGIISILENMKNYSQYLERR